LAVVMKSGKPARPYVVLIVLLVFSALFIGWVKLPLDFDDVYARRWSDFAADNEVLVKLRLRATGVTRHERLGLSRHISGPYRFEVCTSNTIQQDLALKMASLARVVEGQLIPVDAEFNIDGNWVGVDRVCITDLLSLDIDIEVELDEFYCVDLTYDLGTDEHVERTCFRFDHDISHYKVTLWELFIGHLES
jgi:hypothetical protein